MAFGLWFYYNGQNKILEKAGSTMDLVNQPFTEKGKKTLDALVDASRKNFYRKGYYKTTIKDITKDAGVSVGAFYVYFEDKLSVYKYLVTTYGKFIRNHVGKHIAKNSTRREAERAGLIAYIDLVRENPDIYNIVWEALYIDKEIFMEYYLEFSQSYIRQLEKSKAAGEITYQNAEAVSFLLMGMHTFIGLRFATLETREDVEAIVDQVISVMFDGLTAKDKED